jgi:exopolysaccharide production protein ExoZ
VHGRFGQPFRFLPWSQQVRAPGLAAPVPDHRNVRLQHLRALAAVAVVLYHASHYLAAFRGDKRFLEVFSGFFGSYGVAVFFALSGYLMAEIARRDDPAKFLVSRLARIYPPMLLVVALFAAAFALLVRPRGIDALSLTLIPTGPRDYFLQVEWTLLYEMSYYVGLSILGFVGLSRFRSATVGAWLVLICGAFIWGDGRSMKALPYLSEIPVSIVNLPFALGLLLSDAQRRNWLPRFLIVPATGLAIAAYVMSERLEMLQVLAGLSATMLVASAVSAAHDQPGWIGRFGAKLGDASYALYLCHVPVILIAASLLSPAVPSWMVWFLFVSVPIGLSLLLGPIDLELHRRLKRFINAAPLQRLQVTAFAFTAAFIGIAVYTEYEGRLAARTLTTAEHILSQPAQAAGGTVRAAIDSVERLPDGIWVVRGYGIDLERPRLVTHFAVRQSGKVLAIVGMRRMRAAIARELDRADLEGLRFGFTLYLPSDLRCTSGPLEGIFVFEDGRTFQMKPGPLADICRSSG